MDVQHKILQDADSHPLGYIKAVAELPDPAEVLPGVAAFDPQSKLLYVSNGVDSWIPYAPVINDEPHGINTIARWVGEDGHTLEMSQLIITDEGAIQRNDGRLRGVGAVDLQTSIAEEIPAGSGDYSTIGGGKDNLSSGNGATIGGGENNRANAPYSAIPGGQDGCASRYGEQVHSAGCFTTPGDAQTSVLVARGITNGDNWTTLALDGQYEAINIAAESSALFHILLIGRSLFYAPELTRAAFEITGLIDNLAGEIANDYTLHAIAFTHPALDVSITAENGALTIQAKGIANTTMQWVARITLVEVSAAEVSCG